VKRPVLFYPLAVAAYPVVSLYSSNIGHVAFGQAVYPFSFSLLLCGAVWALSALALRSAPKASLLAALSIAMFSLYGTAYAALGQGPADAWQLFRHRHLMALFAIVFAAAFYGLHRLRSEPHGPTKFVAATSVFMLLMPVGSIAAYHLGEHEQPASELAEPIGRYCRIDSLRAARTDTLPDIYYFIADGYSRSDVLDDVYGYDNSRFMGYLRENGFYVAEKSRSNYCYTNLSLPSSINFRPFPDFTTSQTATTMLMRGNRLFAFLKSIGYTTIAYPTALMTEFTNVDMYRGDAFFFMDEFGQMYLDTTPLPPFLANAVGFSFPKRRTENVLEHIVTIPRMREPTVTFAHVVPPHAPYFLGGTYERELDILNEKLMAMVDRLIADSPEPPIIVLQADHGHRTLLYGGEISERSLHDATGILNAYHLPYGGNEAIYSGVTPINT